jgi:hypothetical protein
MEEGEVKIDFSQQDIWDDTELIQQYDQSIQEYIRQHGYAGYLFVRVC